MLNWVGKTRECDDADLDQATGAANFGSFIPRSDLYVR